MFNRFFYLSSLFGIISLLGISGGAQALNPTAAAAISTTITRDAQMFYRPGSPRSSYEIDRAGQCDVLLDTLGLSIPREFQNNTVDFEEIFLAASVNERRTMLIFYGGHCSGWALDVMPLFTKEVATLVREEFYLLPVDVDSNQTYLIDGSDFSSLQLADMLEIEILPTIVVFEGNGKLALHFSKPESPEELLSELKFAVASVYREEDSIDMDTRNILETRR